MKDLRKAKELKLEIWGTPKDLYFMQDTLARLLMYIENTDRKLNYSLTVKDEQGIYEALGKDDTQFILDIVSSIIHQGKNIIESKIDNPWE